MNTNNKPNKIYKQTFNMSDEEWEKLTSILPDEMKKQAEIETDMAFQRYKERRRDNARILLFDGIAVLTISIVLILFNK